MVRVPRDALTSCELLWALLQCGDNCLPSGRFARFATGADIVSWICQLVGATTTSSRSWCQRAYVCRTRSTALPFHRKRPAYEAS
jgi:hypothetical protein